MVLTWESALDFSAVTVLPSLQPPHSFNVSVLLHFILYLYNCICEFSSRSGHYTCLWWWLTPYDSHKPLYVQQGNVGLPNSKRVIIMGLAEARTLHNGICRCFKRPNIFFAFSLYERVSEPEQAIPLDRPYESIILPRWQTDQHTDRYTDERQTCQPYGKATHKHAYVVFVIEVESTLNQKLNSFKMTIDCSQS